MQSTFPLSPSHQFRHEQYHPQESNPSSLEPQSNLRINAMQKTLHESYRYAMIIFTMIILLLAILLLIVGTNLFAKKNCKSYESEINLPDDNEIKQGEKNTNMSQFRKDYDDDEDDTDIDADLNYNSRRRKKSTINNVDPASPSEIHQPNNLTTSEKKVPKARIIIKIGHIGAQNAMPNADKILEISRLQLIDEGLLNEDLDFDINSSYSIQSQAACGESFEGVAVAAAMYHKEKVRAFLGPYCSSGSFY